MDAYGALADPSRRKIVALLANGNRSAGDLAAEFAFSPSAVSQHLKILRSAGLVDVRVEAQRRIYQLNRAQLYGVAHWIEEVCAMWAMRLQTLDDALTSVGR